MAGGPVPMTEESPNNVVTKGVKLTQPGASRALAEALVRATRRKNGTKKNGA